MPAIAATAIDSRAFRVIVSSQRCPHHVHPRSLASGLHRGRVRARVVAFSTKGAIQEVNADGALVQEWVFQGSMATIGYIEKRASLYGPPPH